MKLPFRFGSIPETLALFIGVLLAGLVSPALGQSACAPPPAGLVSWWQAESNALDLIGSNNGQLQTGAGYDLGKVGTAFSFDGVSSKVDLGDPASLAFTNSFSIEGWVWVNGLPPVTQGHGQILYRGDPRFCLDPYYFSVRVNGSLRFHIEDAQDTLPCGMDLETGPLALQQWKHVAAVFDSETGSMQIYVDGQLAAQTNTTVRPFQTLVNGGASIGNLSVGQNGQSFNGLIDELAVYGRALTSAEIAAIYGAGTAGKCFVPTAPVVIVQPTNQTVIVGGQASFSISASGTQPLNYQWQKNGMILTGAVGASLTISNVQLSDAASYSVIVSNTAGGVTSSSAILNVLPPCQPAPAGLISWWQAETNAHDIVGINDGTLVGGATFAAGEVGNGFSFNGAGAFVEIPDSPSLRFTNELTVELWYRDTGAPAGHYYGLIAKRAPYPDGCNFGIDILTGSPGTLQVYIQDPNYGGYLGSVSVAPSPGVFHHVAATYRQAAAEQVELKTYVDGQLIQTGTVSGNLARTLNNAPVTIGADDPNETYFVGVIDEPSLYNRALSEAEVQAVYNAGVSGKCSGSIPPTIVTQPSDQTVVLGRGVIFIVAAGGSPPLTYQWEKNGTTIGGATTTILSLNNVQLSDAGSYSVVVSNAAGSVTSAAAVLTVNPPPPCQTPPSGLVAWWKGDGDASDVLGGNNGTLENGVGFVSGKVGQAFVFNGVNQFVEIPDSPSLDPANALTLETWVYVSGNPNTDLATIVTKFSPFDPQLNQYQLETHYAGGRLNFRPLLFLPSGYGLVDGATTIQFNTWYHVAMTYDGSSLKLYVNGALDGSVAASGSIVPTTEPLRIGGPSSGPWWFNGRVDEVSLYDRALSGAEIQSIYSAGAAGKCAGSFPPLIQTQPSDQTVYVGSTATFSVVAGGSPPLSYHWEKNGGLLNGATTTVLSLTNVQLSDAGSYSVVMTNVAGSITSSPAMLTVSLPPASIQVGAATVAADGTVTVPVSLVANGNESALGFSLNFDPTLLTNTGVVLGSGASGASLFPNLIHAGTGQLGVAVGLPIGATFSPGTQQVVVVSFASPLVTSATSTPVAFGDSPVKRELSDATGIPVSATFSSGSVLLPPSQLEGDAFPRPNGDGALTVSDWVLIGRYVARLDSPTNALEFQKADCAPRDTLGDGALTVSDWVQAGRYVAGLDPAARVGGPTSEGPQVVVATVPSSVTRRTESNPRQVRLIAPALLQGQTGTVEVDLESQGNENALAFSLSFDPASLVFVGAAAGNAASGAILNVNAKQAAQGRLGCVLALTANTSFPAGSKQVVNVSFRAATAAVTGLISFGDMPVPRGVSDPSASALTADYINAAVVISSLPTLKIVASAKSVNLSWPISATGFVLQESSDSRMAASSWTTVTATPGVVNNQSVVSVPASATAKFYRLYHQ